MARRLVAQAEAKKPSGRWWFGYELFDVDGEFRLVIHTSTYDGIKRDDHHATPEVALTAVTKEAALDEAAKTTSLYARSVLGLAVA
jgi:hypothetical protein